MPAPAARIELTGFDHVDLVVPDRGKARHFFVDQLGLEVIGEGPDHTFLLFGDQVLGLRNGDAARRHDGVHHLALRVAEWTGLRNRVKRARIVVVGEKERDDSRSLFLKGPDGLRVELVYRPDPHVHTSRRVFHTPAPNATSDDEDEAMPAPPRKRSR